MAQQLDHQADADIQALKVTLDRLLHNVGMLLSVPSASVALLDAESGDLVTWAALGVGPEGPVRTRFRPNEGIAGWVAAHLEPLNIPDVSRDPRFRPLRGTTAIRSMLCVPLIDTDQLLGTLTVTSSEPAAFDKRRQELLQVFSDQAVLAISKTRQAETAKAQARELAALLDASRALTSTLEPEHVFEYLVSSIRKVIACDDAVIYRYDEHTETLRIVTGMGPRIMRLGKAVVSADDEHSIAAWVAKNRRARMSSPQITEVGTVTKAFLAGDELALLCVPLASKDRLRGVIMLAREQPFQPSELMAMLNLSNLVAATLENAQMYQTSRAEKDQQAAIYAAASDAIAVLDGDLRIIEANDAFARLTGRSRFELAGLQVIEALHLGEIPGPIAAATRDVIARGLQTGAPLPHMEVELPNLETAPLNGQSPKRYIDISVTPVMRPEGRRLLLVGRDMTAFHEMEVMKENFLTMVSHELRTPLQAINGYLDLTLSGMAGELNGQQNEFVRRARAGSEHLTALVDDLLLISRRDAGQFALHFEETDLGEVITETAEQLEVLAQDKGVRLQVRIPPLPHISADAQRIAQVVRNLVTNAVKFTDAGGTVGIVAEATRTHVLLRVHDSGIGIPPEHIDKIFDRFYQVNAGRKSDRAHGQGLGLAIVRIIVEGHDGRVTVESAPSHGSTFTVIFPRERAGQSTLTRRS
jgi:signal transduction histidine kinase